MLFDHGKKLEVIKRYSYCIGSSFKIYLDLDIYCCLIAFNGLILEHQYNANFDYKLIIKFGYELELLFANLNMSLNAKNGDRWVSNKLSAKIPQQDKALYTMVILHVAKDCKFSNAAIEGNLPTSFNHLRRIPRFLNQDRMDKLGPSDAGASTLKSSLPRITAAIKPAQHAKVELINDRALKLERRRMRYIEKINELNEEEIERYFHQGMTGESFSNNSKGKETSLAPSLSPGIVDHQHGDVHCAEASRKRKDKSVLVYQAPKQRRENNCVPGRSTSKGIVIGSRHGDNDNLDPVDYDISSDDGDYYEIDTSDDDVAADDANQISRYVRPHDNKPVTSTSSTVSEMAILPRSPRLCEQPQIPKYYRISNRNMKGVRHFLGKMDVKIRGSNNHTQQFVWQSERTFSNILSRVSTR
ncbi:uncharacterized protein LOC113325462 isoform X3 [Papaver somniferum]|uniref:uncharacterized protein LOC113325462 isoform X3 n=1 Tax=Papaver somniferum TaxID=3469 RepID=UPI000E6FCFAC|nr:uncharacterized protein LOC113325462 isoform X3 [Papaver somniferum]